MMVWFNAKQASPPKRREHVGMRFIDMRRYHSNIVSSQLCSSLLCRLIQTTPAGSCVVNSIIHKTYFPDQSKSFMT